MHLPLTLTDILDALTDAESTAYRNLSRVSGADDPLPGILDRTITEVRGYVAACRDNRLGQAGTIPSELHQAATDLVAQRLLNRIPGLGSDFRQGRDDAARAATALLRDVAACKFAVEPPEEPSSTRPASGRVAVVSSRPNRAKGNEL